MNYYVKSPKDSEVHGPHSLQEINKRLEDGSLSSEWSATADLGEGTERVERSRPSDWVPLLQIRGVMGHQPGPEPAANWRAVFLIVLCIVGAFVVYEVLALLSEVLKDLH